MIYKINGNYLDVKNEIKEFENLILFMLFMIMLSL